MANQHQARITTIAAEPEPIRIDVLKTAIIVVDMQNAFVKRGGYFDLAGYDLSGVEKIVGPCKKIITLAREKGAKIIYFQMGCSSDLSDRGPADSPYNLKAKGLKLIRERPEVKDKFYIYGLWGAEIIKSLSPRRKTWWSGSRNMTDSLGPTWRSLIRKWAAKRDASPARTPGWLKWKPARISATPSA
jgi:hypothetical protein